MEVGGVVQFQHPVVQQAAREALYCNTADLGVVKSFLNYYKSADEYAYIHTLRDDCRYNLYSEHMVHGWVGVGM